MTSDYKVSLIDADTKQTVRFNFLIESMTTRKQFIARIPDDYFAYNGNKIFTLDHASTIIRELLGSQSYQIYEHKEEDIPDENNLDITLTLVANIVSNIELKESMTFRAIAINETAEQREIRALKCELRELNKKFTEYIAETDKKVEELTVGHAITSRVQEIQSKYCCSYPWAFQFIKDYVGWELCGGKVIIYPFLKTVSGDGYWFAWIRSIVRLINGGTPLCKFGDIDCTRLIVHFDEGKLRCYDHTDKDNACHISRFHKNTKEVVFVGPDQDTADFSQQCQIMNRIHSKLNIRFTFDKNITGVQLTGIFAQAQIEDLKGRKMEEWNITPELAKQLQEAEANLAGIPKILREIPNPKTFF